MRVWMVLPVMVFSASCLGDAGSEAPMVAKKAAAMDDMTAARAAPEYLEEDKAPPSEEAPSSTGTGGGEEMPALPTERMLIREAHITAEVAEFNAALNALRSLAEEEKGFVVRTSRSIDSYQEVDYGEVVFRVPSARFDAVMERLQSIFSKVESVSVTTDDVTEEFVDVAARIRTKKRLEERYLDILTRAGAMKEVLEVERALAEVREELERLEGRSRYLRDRVSLSTFTVELHEPYASVASGEGGPLKTLSRSFSKGAEAFVFVLAGLISFVIGGTPVFLILGGIGLGLAWWIRRRRRAAKETPAT